MRNIWTIARREYRLYFVGGPIAYIVALVALLIVGLYFTVVLFYASSQSYYGTTPPDTSIITSILGLVFLFAAPALTMRLLADEQRSGTLELLLTAPITDAELVVGKWLGAFLFALTIIAMTLIFPILLNRLTNPGIDQGVMLSNYVAIILLVAAFLAIGTAMSSLFKNQFAAFFSTLGILLTLWILIGLPTYVIQNVSINNVFNYFNLNSRFSAMAGGTVTITDLIFPLSLTALGLFLGTVAVETRRWQ